VSSTRHAGADTAAHARNGSLHEPEHHLLAQHHSGLLVLAQREPTDHYFSRHVQSESSSCLFFFFLFLSFLLCCLESLTGTFLQLIAWCAAAAKNTPRANTSEADTPVALKELLRSPPAGLDGLMDALGATGNEQVQAAAQTVLNDLYRVQDLVNLFSQRLSMARRRRSAVGGGEAGSDILAAMYNTSTTLSEVSGRVDRSEIYANERTASIGAIRKRFATTFTSCQLRDGADPSARMSKHSGLWLPMSSSRELET